MHISDSGSYPLHPYTLASLGDSLNKGRIQASGPHSPLFSPLAVMGNSYLPLMDPVRLPRESESGLLDTPTYFSVCKGLSGRHKLAEPMWHPVYHTHDTTLLRKHYNAFNSYRRLLPYMLQMLSHSHATYTTSVHQ
jgi:hypothetical protein